MKKEMITKLNKIAQEDFSKAESMLDGINMVLGTNYGWLAKRVVFFDTVDGTHDYARCHDAEPYAI